VEGHVGGALGAVGFYCDECEYQGGSRTGYYDPLFFVEEYVLSKHDHKMIVSEIQRHYIGAGNLTQTKLEAFFRDDTNFTPLLIDSTHRQEDFGCRR
jgi:hypothetical protein